MPRAPAGATSFTYDQNGNQLTGGTNATYDDKGRVAALGGSAMTHLSSTNAELTGLGSSTFQNTLLGVSTITVSGNVSRIQRSPDDGAAVSQTRDSARRWFVQDHLGSTIALASSTGSIERKYDYTVDGEDSPSGSGPATWIRYAGGHDLGNGLYHFGQRYYSPGSARWTQRDPLDQPDDLINQNPYVYAGNNPVSFSDPSGEVPLALLAIGARALYAAGRAAAPRAIAAVRSQKFVRAGSSGTEKFRVSVGHTPKYGGRYGAHAHVGTSTQGGSVYGPKTWSYAYRSKGSGGRAGLRKPRP